MGLEVSSPVFLVSVTMIFLSLKVAQGEVPETVYSFPELYVRI